MTRIKSPASVGAIVSSLVFHGMMIVIVVRALSSHSERPAEPLQLETRVVIIPPTPPLAVPAAYPPPKKDIPVTKPGAMPKPAPMLVAPREVTVPRSELPEPPRDIRPAPTSLVAPAPTVASVPQTPSPPPAKTGVSISADYAAGNRKPLYPPLSRRYGEQGSVMLRVFVSTDGTAVNIEIKTSSGYPLLDEAAREAVKTWRFVPASIDGKPIGEWLQVPIPFKLNN